MTEAQQAIASVMAIFTIALIVYTIAEFLSDEDDDWWD